MLFSPVAFLRRSQYRFWKWASTHLIKPNIVIICLEILTKFFQIFFWDIFSIRFFKWQADVPIFLDSVIYQLFFPLENTLYAPYCASWFLWLERTSFTCTSSSGMRKSAGPSLLQWECTGHVLRVPCCAKHLEGPCPHGTSGPGVQ